MSTDNDTKKENFFGFMAFAILIEAIITYFREFFIDGNSCWQMAVSIGLSVVVAISYSLDIPKYFGLNSKVPYVGFVITGILISRGSNYVFDLIGKLSSM